MGTLGVAGDTEDGEPVMAGDTRMRNGGCLGGTRSCMGHWDGKLGVAGDTGDRELVGAGDTGIGNWGWQGTPEWRTGDGREHQDEEKGVPGDTGMGNWWW